MPQPILIFDSGIGGLSVLAEIRQQLPHYDYVYLFDNARLPYGELSDHELTTGAVQLIRQGVQASQAQLVVIACNTASTLILSELRSVLDVPVVGVVPAIKPAAKLSQTQHIALLATPATINRDYTQALISSYAPTCKVSMLASSELVWMAEQKLAQQKIDIALLNQILLPIQNTDIDVLVLGCTHFPLLKAEISQIVNSKVQLVDSGKAIACRVVSLIQSQAITLNDSKVENYSSSKGILSAYYTSQAIEESLTRGLIDFGFTKVSPVITGLDHEMRAIN